VLLIALLAAALLSFELSLCVWERLAAIESAKDRVPVELR